MNAQIKNALRALYKGLLNRERWLVEENAQHLADVVALTAYRVKSFEDLVEPFKEGWLNNDVDFNEESIVLFREGEVIECYHESANIIVHLHNKDLTVKSPLAPAPKGGMATVHILKDGKQINEPSRCAPSIGVDVNVTPSGALVVRWPEQTDIYGPDLWDQVTHLRDIQGW